TEISNRRSHCGFQTTPSQCWPSKQRCVKLASANSWACSSKLRWRGTFTKCWIRSPSTSQYRTFSPRSGFYEPTREVRWQPSPTAGDGNSSVLTSEKTLARGSSVIATVEPAPIPRRVLYAVADVPLNAGCLVVSEIATSTARQEHQRQPSERSFDN